MTIGVIDEVRKLGIGSRLLQQVTELMLNSYYTVEALYLHVVSYNHSALAFYDKNGFLRVAELKEWYTIHGEKFDALLLYKPLVRDDFDENV